jgi:hypothetical protein
MSLRDPTPEELAEFDEQLAAERERVERLRPRPNNQDSAAPCWRAHVMTAAVLRTMTFPELVYVVPRLVAEGLAILADRPKVGKSWMALDLCLGVAAGCGVIGGIMPAQGDVLYCALEDTTRRLQRRVDKLVSPFSAEWPERLTLATRWRRLDAGGVDDIAAWADTVITPRLVVLDTLAGVRPAAKNGEQLYDQDYKALVDLHRLAGDRHMAVLVLHHTRKLEADDPLDTVSGTLGLAGCADTVLVLARGSQGTTLYVRGRDIEENERAITWDAAACRWSLGGDAADAHRSAGRQAILAVLSKPTITTPLTPQDIAAATGLDKANVDRLLGRMVTDSEVVRLARGRYVHPARQDIVDADRQAPPREKRGKREMATQSLASLTSLGGRNDSRREAVA